MIFVESNKRNNIDIALFFFKFKYSGNFKLAKFIFSYLYYNNFILKMKFYKLHLKKIQVCRCNLRELLTNLVKLIILFILLFHQQTFFKTIFFICPFRRIKRILPIGLKKKRSSCRKRKWKGEDVGITTLFIAAAVHRGE